LHGFENCERDEDAASPRPVPSWNPAKNTGIACTLYLAGTGYESGP
jgi:hypothetical protein